MKKLLYLLAIIPLIALSCKKEPKVEAATFIINNEEITIGTTTAVLTVTFSYPGNLERIDGLISENSDMSNAIVAHALINQNKFVVKFVGLQMNKQYYYQYEYSTGLEVEKTSVSTFVTNDYAVPTVTTAEITDIDATSAKCGGEVIDEGGMEVTARGVCWSMSHNPTIDDPHTTDGSGVGTFTSLITVTGLQTYYVRAYAVNSKGTGYGEERSFEVYIPQSGLFSVSDTKKVRIALGNLQYQASTNTWRFAEHPWDVVGYEGNNYHQNLVTYGNVYENNMKCNNYLASASYSGWIDLFMWGTSGYNHGAECYQPWSCIPGSYNNDQSIAACYAYGFSYMNLYDMTGMADWGYNPISNGGDEENQWRTLRKEEWDYMLNTRETPSGLRYVSANVNGIEGYLLLPDNWNTNAYHLVNVTGNYDYGKNVISLNDWTNIVAPEGAVFLPITGHLLCYQNATYIPELEIYPMYWTSSQYSSVGKSPSFIYQGQVHWCDSGMKKLPVRLVRDAQ